MRYSIPSLLPDKRVRVDGKAKEGLKGVHTTAVSLYLWKILLYVRVFFLVSFFVGVLGKKRQIPVECAFTGRLVGIPGRAP